MSRAREEAAALLLALRFLTRLPLPDPGFTPARMRAATAWLPLAGAGVGLFSAAAFLAAASLLPPAVALLLATGATLLLTGGLHEDGLADTADALSAPSRERALAIMRDSRIGAHGALALGLVLATRVAALATLAAWPAALALAAAAPAGRASAVLVIATARYAREGGAGTFTARGLSRRRLALALAPALAALAVLGLAAGPGAAAGAALGLATGHATRGLWERKLGGYTGDTLGATEQLSELGLVLGLVACL